MNGAEAAPIKCDGRESAGLPTLSIKESVGLPAALSVLTVSRGPKIFKICLN